MWKRGASVTANQASWGHAQSQVSPGGPSPPTSATPPPHPPGALPAPLSSHSSSSFKGLESRGSPRSPAVPEALSPLPASLLRTLSSAASSLLELVSHSSLSASPRREVGHTSCLLCTLLCAEATPVPSCCPERGLPADW